jgi:outer membrane receptor protein involved in Fe transport
VEVIVDDRRRNLSSLLTSGIDFSLSYGIDALGGLLNASIDATHILFVRQKLTSLSESFDTDDTFYNPANWRARAALNWQGQALSLSGFVNYTDSYVDNRSPILRSVDSYLTLDARAAYEFPKDRGWLAGLAIALSAQNLFDRGPPKVQSFDPLFDLGFDPTNASPLGRLIAIEVVKRW